MITTVVDLAARVTSCLPWCEGHLGKYEDCLTEALHEAVSSMVGYADEESGSVECPTGYFWLVSTQGDVQINADEWSGDVKVIITGPVNAIIRTNDQGAVWSEWHPSGGAARDAFDELDHAYGIWSEVNDY